MRILIMEDEEIAGKHLQKILKKARPDWDYLGVIPSVKEGLKWFKSNPEPDLIFSDIELQDGLSFEIFKELALKSPIIFTTAYDQYAIKAFEVNSIDYILKPIKEEKVIDALQKMEDLGKLGRSEESTLDMGQLMNLIRKGSGQFKARFLVKSSNKIISIPTPEIAYFHSKNKLSFLVKKDGGKFPVDYSLEELEGLLDPGEFFRINRAFIIHLEAAKEIKPYFKGRLRLMLSPDAVEDVVVSGEKSSQFKAWLDQ